jgi:hypothetical protein
MLDPGVWVAVYMPIIIALVITARNKRQMMRNRIIKKSSHGGDGFMNELVRTFLGKQCVVYTFEGNRIKGTIEKVEGNWISISTAKEAQIVNADFISRIRQCTK